MAGGILLSFIKNEASTKEILEYFLKERKRDLEEKVQYLNHAVAKK